MSNRSFAVMAISVLLIAGLIVVGASQNWFGEDKIVRRGQQLAPEPESTSSEGNDSQEGGLQPEKTRSIAEALGVEESDMAIVGGIARPKRDLAESNPLNKNELPKNPLPNPGRQPALKGDENPQVERYFEELKDSESPVAARSSMFLPEPFDKERYFANPEEYLQKIRPGRAFQAAQPAAGVKPLVPVSAELQTLLQGETSIINVKTSEPNYPVAFYAPDGGEFSNRLKSITVASDEDGIARVEYKATAGTQGLMNVIAAGPLNSGQAKFAIRVLLPSN